MSASSTDLHPTSGARFVMVRDPQVEDPAYRVDVYLPEGRHVGGALRWAEGESVVELEQPAPDAADTWVREEVRKLARVLKRDPKARIIRWRDAP